MNKKIVFALSFSTATVLFGDSYTINKMVIADDRDYTYIIKSKLKESALPKRYTKEALVVLAKQSNMNIFSVIDMKLSISFSLVDIFVFNKSLNYDFVCISGKKQSNLGEV